MMRAGERWAVAVQAPAGLEVTGGSVDSLLLRHRILRLPVLRGIVGLAESMRVGFRALNISINATMGEEQQEMTTRQWLFALVAGVGLAVGLFFVVPVTLTSLVKDELDSAVLFWLVEGALRTTIFVGYLVVITRLAHLRRLFEYHGAEHKTIACLEAGRPLTPENAQRFSRLHPRCGTSLMLLVMIVAIFVLAPIGLPAWYWLVLSRVLGVPLVAGLSYELIRATGMHRGALWARLTMWPGMQLQRLTTREPDHAQLAVAIAALTAVLDAPEAPPAPPAAIGVVA